MELISSNGEVSCSLKKADVRDGVACLVDQMESILARHRLWPMYCTRKNFAEDLEVLNLEGRNEKLRELCKKAWCSPVLSEHSEDLVMKDKVKFLLRKCEAIREERDHLVHKCKHDVAERDALKLELSHLKGNCKDMSLLEEELRAAKTRRDKLAEQRNSLRLSVRRSEANCDAIRKVMEEQKVETQEIKGQLKEFALLKNKMNSVRQKCEDMTKERDTYMAKERMETEGLDTLRVQRDALKLELEYVKDKIKRNDQLEKQLHSTVERRRKAKAERDLLKSRLRWLETDTEATVRYSDALETEIEALRQRCSKVPLLEKKFNIISQQYENMKREKRGLILKERRIAADIDALTRDRDTLKLVVETLRAQCSDAAGLEKPADVSS
jgi:chromosome segregation ATPase